MSRLNFNLRGRELSADFEYGSAPERLTSGIPSEKLEIGDIDDDFEIYEVFDAITGEKIECTKEIRHLVMEIFLKEMNNPKLTIELRTLLERARK